MMVRRSKTEADASPADPTAPNPDAGSGAPPDAPVLRAYPVLSPLKHGGRLYLPVTDAVTVITLPDGEAEALQAIGVLGEPL